MKESSITIKFPIRWDTDGNGFSYVDDIPQSITCYAGSVQKAKDLLKKALKKEISECLTECSNSRRCYIFCGDGTLLLVEYRLGSWGYSICGADRSYASGCWGLPIFEDAVSAAEKHAGEAYGGVKGKHS